MTASELFAPHPGDHCAEPVSPAVAAFRYLRRLVRQWRGRKAVPAVLPSAGAAPALVADGPHIPADRFATESLAWAELDAGRPVLGDKWTWEVQAQWNAFHDDDQPSFTPARPTFTPSAAMDTGEFAVLDAKVDAVLRPVNGRNLGTQPRQQSVYGERCQLDVERDMALAAGERARQGYVPASPRLLDQVLAGLRKL